MRKVSPGDRKSQSADFQNKVIDVVNDRKKKVAGRSSSWSPNDPDIIRIENNHTAALDVYNVLKITGIKISPANKPFGYVLSGDQPDANEPDKFAVIARPVKVGKVGLGVVSGVTPVKVNIVSTSHEFANAKNGDVTQLESAESGVARILWRESGTGTKWAIVRLGGSGNSDSDIIPVTLTHKGGSQGTATTVASWTYDVTNARTSTLIEAAVDIAAGVHNLYKRPKGHVTKATFGLLWDDPSVSAGTGRVIYANEQPAFAVRTPAP